MRNNLPSPTRRAAPALLFLILLSLFIASCGATPETTTVVVTEIVEREVEREVVVTEIVEREVEVEREVVVTATAAPEPDTSSEPVTLRFTTWTGNAGHLEVLNAIAADYQELHPNVTIQYDTISTEDYP